MKNPVPPEDDILPAFGFVLIAIIIAFFVVRNVPWHLDDDEQAKQAFVSYQMTESGRWLLQETPTGRVATKPPLQGWIAAGMKLGLGDWSSELAWRLPPFLAALFLLRRLWRAGEDLYGNNIGAVLAIGMFGLNFYVPRLATLVRTDMLLSTLIFLAGWIIMEKLRTGKPWTQRDRLNLTLVLLGSTLTKGPIAYGFLLPGIIAYLLITRKWEIDRRVWPGWWPWLIPLAIFGAWVGLGCATDKDFYDQVVVKEFLGRFTVGEGARHHNFPPGFYTLGILGRTLPWTLLLCCILGHRAVRSATRIDPALLWLACWSLGGLIFMELVPSKRFDRILPALPPLCLLLAASARYLPKFKLFGQPMARLTILLTLLAIPVAGSYVGWRVYSSLREQERTLVDFGYRVQQTVGLHRDRLAVVNGKDEGMLIYTHVDHFTRLRDALTMWRFKKVDWLVLPESEYKANLASLQPMQLIDSTPPFGERNARTRYYLVQRVSPKPEAPLPPPKSEGPPAEPGAASDGK